MKKIVLLFALLSCVLPVFGQVTADFTPSTTEGCAPLVVNFNNTSSGATTYNWNFGNNTSSQQTSPAASYVTPGTYTVTLTASNGSATSTKTATITVYAPPSVAFSVNDTQICPGTTVTFTDQSNLQTNGAGTYAWNFGDGNSSTQQNPSHIFYTPSYYNITLTAINSKGCSSTLTKTAYVHVLNPPVINFTANAYVFCSAPAHVIFNNLTSGTSPLTYAWNFGDNTSSTASNPTHDYTTPGSTYDVTLVATDANGCKDTSVHTAFIHINNFTGSFSAPATACVYQQVSFQNTTTASYVSSNWDFGDGGTSTANNPTHTYGSAGTYNVQLVVYDGNCYDTIIHPITINPQPLASFTFTPAHPCPAPIAIQFHSTAPANSTYSWDFGDGGTSTAANPVHTYQTNDFDTMSVVITNANGCADTLHDTVKIYDLIGFINEDKKNGCLPLTVHFSTTTLTSVPPPAPVGLYPYPFGTASYSWNFGDGSTSTQAAPVHTYNTSGDFLVTMTLTTIYGCTATDSIHIQAGNKPSGSFTINPTEVCIKKYMDFHATAVGDTPLVFTWAWNDGSSATVGVYDSVVHHQFLTPGNFNPFLIISNYGCSDTVYGPPIIIDSPGANMHYTYSCDTPGLVTFVNTSLGATSYEWNFGDGTTSQDSIVAHTYPSLSNYVAEITTYNSTSGCRDTLDEYIYLYHLTPSFVADDTAICIGGTVHFTPSATGGPPDPLTYSWYVNGQYIDTIKYFHYTYNTSGIYNMMLVTLDGHYCKDTATRNGYILVAKPIDSFTANPLAGCLPETANFTDLTTDVPGTYMTSYEWDFGDNTTATVTTDTTSHYYSTSGIFDIQEIVTDNIGCKDTFQRLQYIHVNKPHASFTNILHTPCIGVNVHFTNLSGPGLTAFWDFGDGTTSSNLSPDHAYTQPGTYNVKLVVTDATGCTDTMIQTGNILVTKPHAAFTMNDSTGICVPLQVQFTNISTGAYGYYWNFGNGNNSFAANPSNPYSVPGYYTVMLIATDSNGCTDSATAHVNLYGYAGAFSYTPLIGCSPLTVSYTANVSNVSALIWDFSDGTIQTSTTTTIQHTYTTPGSYVPKLILNDTLGCQASSVGLDTIKVDGVTAGYTTIPNPICIKDTVQFQDTSKSLFSGIATWQWYFDNGDVSSSATASHYYETVGNYTVTLVTTDSLGCKDTLNNSVYVNPVPTITASGDTIICVGDAAQLAASGGVSYVWEPPATLSCATCQSPNASPTTPTVYTVIGTDANGCSSRDSVTVSLQTKTTSVTGTGGAICYGDSIMLSASGAQNYTWLPQDGLNNSHIANPSASPQTSTTYLVIAKEGSCEPDTNTVSVVVHPLPKLITNGDQTIVAGNTAVLQASGNNVTTFVWSPAASLTCDSCSNPTSNTQITTTYTVTGYTDYGCQASDSVTIHVLCDKSQVFIPNTFTPNGDGQNDVFYPRGTGIKIVKSFRIYNRWGEMVFERTDFSLNDESAGWDGTYKGSLPRPDVYVYSMDAVCQSGEDVNWKGDVTIIR